MPAKKRNFVFTHQHASTDLFLASFSTASQRLKAAATDRLVSHYQKRSIKMI